MSKKIIAIGLDLASDQVQKESFTSKASLLDWDIILFRPQISDFIRDADTYQGRPSLEENSSFRLKESCEHWRREIKQAFETGKCVIIFLSELSEIYVDSGERQYSGTGRNTRITRIVASYSNYKCLPVVLDPINAKGSAITLGEPWLDILSEYWREFEADSEYNVILSKEIKGVCLTTKNGNKSVGAVIRNKDSVGALVLLPNIGFDRSDFWIDRQYHGRYGSAEGKQFAARLVSAVVVLDRKLRSSADFTPPPEWAAHPAHALMIEKTLSAELLDAERRVEEASKHKENIEEKLRDAGRLRALLYEKGKPLENAIIEALIMIGFEAAQYKEANSEFDVVFTCIEGRLLGEAEGKDTKAVNVDKLRQLSMNIHEDLQRDEILMPAKGVLFGNGFRLHPPGERGVQFTEKCIVASKTQGVALVSTSELFKVARYLSDQPDEDFAKQCRTSLLEGFGLVNLPAPPEALASPIVEVAS
jgi:hypothetical protein